MSASANASGYIGNGIEVAGDLNFTGQLYVDGSVSGTLTTDSGTLIVGKQGQVRAQIAAERCVVQGTVIGDVIASGTVEIQETGYVQGKVVTPQLSLAEGAVLDGQLVMGDQVERPVLGRAKPKAVSTNTTGAQVAA
jgi:cytoskeletal protein CcmA (bactofilin family)